MKKYKAFLESLEDDKKNFIENVVYSEVDKSNKFGLDIEEEDILLEVNFFTKEIIPIWDDITRYSNIRYSQKISELTEKANSLLRSKYYFDKLSSENSPVKTAYSLHISSIISQLFLKISNGLY